MYRLEADNSWAFLVGGHILLPTTLHCCMLAACRLCSCRLPFLRHLPPAITLCSAPHLCPASCPHIPALPIHTTGMPLAHALPAPTSMVCLACQAACCNAWLASLRVATAPTSPPLPCLPHCTTTTHIWHCLLPAYLWTQLGWRVLHRNPYAYLCLCATCSAGACRAADAGVLPSRLNACRALAR